MRLQGAAVSKNVSRRPIGGPNPNTTKQARAAAAATAVADVQTEQTPVENGPSNDAAVSSAQHGDVAVGALVDVSAAGGMAAPVGLAKRRSGAIGGRLRKKLAKERAAASLASKAAVAAG